MVIHHVLRAAVTAFDFAYVRFHDRDVAWKLYPQPFVVISHRVGVVPLQPVGAGSLTHGLGWRVIPAGAARLSGPC